MPLTFCPTKGLGPNHFSAFEGARKIGRIYKTAEGDWFWGVDLLEARCKLITDYAPTLEEATAELKRVWTDMLWATVLEAGAMSRAPDLVARETQPASGEEWWERELEEEGKWHLWR
jgi:hypothetical protein